MLRWLTGYAIVILLAYLVLLASTPAAVAEIEIRSEVRAGDLLFNDEAILAPFEYDVFHSQTAAATDTEAFALSPLSPGAGDGIAIASTSARTITATQTGFFHAFLPNFRIVDLPGEFVGQGLAWAGNPWPLRIAGLPANTAMIFPQMTEITRMDNEPVNWNNPGNVTGKTGNISNNTSGHINNSSYTVSNPGYKINSNFSKPYYPGNMMLVKNVTNSKGVNETTIVPVPRDYMLFIATPAQIANKTIMERMWRDVHVNYRLDWAYSGETCYPGLICPLKSPVDLMYFYPLYLSNRDALVLTRPGQHIKELFWPVG